MFPCLIYHNLQQYKMENSTHLFMKISLLLLFCLFLLLIVMKKVIIFAFKRMLSQFHLLLHQFVVSHSMWHERKTNGSACSGMVLCISIAGIFYLTGCARVKCQLFFVFAFIRCINIVWSIATIVMIDPDVFLLVKTPKRVCCFYLCANRLIFFIKLQMLIFILQ